MEHVSLEERYGGQMEVSVRGGGGLVSSMDIREEVAGEGGGATARLPTGLVEGVRRNEEAADSVPKSASRSLLEEESKAAPNPTDPTRSEDMHYLDLSKGEVMQSSIEAGAGAERAIDGKTNGVFKDGSCTHTKIQTNPWWRVQLVTRHLVNEVSVWNRADCCGESLNGFQVRVGDSLDWKKNALCGGNANSIKTGESKVVTCGAKTAGSYVYITSPRTVALALCEVKIKGEIQGMSKSETHADKLRQHVASPITFKSENSTTSNETGVVMSVSKEEKVVGFSKVKKEKVTGWHPSGPRSTLSMEKRTRKKAVPGGTYAHWKLDVVEPASAKNGVDVSYVRMTIETRKPLQKKKLSNEHTNMHVSNIRVMKAKGAIYYDYSIPKAKLLKAEAVKLEAKADALKKADEKMAPGFLTTGSINYRGAKEAADRALVDAKAAAKIMVPIPGMVVSLRAPNGMACSGLDKKSVCDSGAPGFQERLLVVDAGGGYVGFKGGKHLCVKSGKAMECAAEHVSDANKFKIIRRKNGRFTLQHKANGMYCSATKAFKCEIFHDDEAESFTAGCLNMCGDKPSPYGFELLGEASAVGVTDHDDKLSIDPKGGDRVGWFAPGA